MATQTANYTFAQLQDLWLRAGGDPKYANIAASVALAESSGNPNNISPTGDYGLWQINKKVHSNASLDPLKNAQQAVAISSKGSNWKPWCTAWTDAACGTKGGSYNLTSGSPASKILSTKGGGSVPSGSTPGVTGGTTDPGTTTTPALFNPLNDAISSLIGSALKPVIKFIVIAVELGAGGVLMMVGIMFLVYDSKSVKDGMQSVGKLAEVAALL